MDKTMEKAIFNNQINEAVEAHVAWRIRLEEAIEQGTSEYSVEELRASNLCVFGKWLYLEVDQSLQNTEQYKKVRDLHQAFHNTAADILNMALVGQKDQAKNAMQEGSEYVRLSTELINAMKQWRDMG